MEIEGPISGSTIKGPAGQRDYASWVANLEDGCTALIRTVIENNQLRIDQVTFTCPDGREPTTSTFRALRLGDFKLRVIERIQSHPDILARPHRVIAELLGQPNVDHGEIQKAARHLRKGPAKGRAARSPDFYRDTARMYLRLWPEHGQRVVAAMASELGKSRNTVSTWVRRAREEGWLSKGTQGKAGGEPGPKLIEWEHQQGEAK